MKKNRTSWIFINGLAPVLFFVGSVYLQGSPDKNEDTRKCFF